MNSQNIFQWIYTNTREKSPYIIRKQTHHSMNHSRKYMLQVLTYKIEWILNSEITLAISIIVVVLICLTSSNDLAGSIDVNNETCNPEDDRH